MSIAGIAQSMHTAETFQSRFAEMKPDHRERALGQHVKLIARSLSKLRLEGMCWQCFCVLDSYIAEDDECDHCGSNNIASPYFN